MLTIMPQLSLAAHFPRRYQAERVYTEIVALLDSGSLPISIFRLVSDGCPYVVLVGEEEDMVVWQYLADHLRGSGGTLVALDDATIDGLFAKRATQRC